MGRGWQAPEGNLAASCLIRPRPGEGPPEQLGFVAALAVQDVVHALAPAARLELKWPNDVMLDGAKLSGILLEREGDVLVLGVGVNLAEAPPVPGRRTAALAEAGVAIAPEAFAEQLAAAFEARRGQWQSGGFPAIAADWLARAHRTGTRLVVAGQGLSGRFAGLGPDGALLLDGDNGVRHVVRAGDVWPAV